MSYGTFAAEHISTRVFSLDVWRDLLVTESDHIIVHAVIKIIMRKLNDSAAMTTQEFDSPS